MVVPEHLNVFVCFPFLKKDLLLEMQMPWSPRRGCVGGHICVCAPGGSRQASWDRAAGLGW